jgi:predicted MPP superfamily phosphohydrolase
MKLSQTIIFFGIVFAVYGLINFYIAKRILSAVPEAHKTLATYILVFVIISYVAGRFLENVWVWYISDLLVWVGSFWIAIMFYLLILILLVDFLHVVNYLIPFFPSVVKTNPEKIRSFVASVIAIFVLITVVGGFLNSRILSTRKYNITIHKKAGDLKSLNIVMASDLHLGTINGKNFAYRVVDKINKLKPDIILFAGDIIDEDIKPVLRNNVGEALYELNAKYGIYGITGNHEYIGGVKDAVEYLTNHNIKMIRDEYVKIEDSFFLVGREDRSSKRFSNYNRKSLDNILIGVDKSLPIILMDHQPSKLEEAKENGIDLQLSGHTHNGQLWPLNYLIEKIYDLSWGYARRGDTHYYVSCGVGGWGPPVRTGSRPEIINIKLSFIQ